VTPAAEKVIFGNSTGHRRAAWTNQRCPRGCGACVRASGHVQPRSASRRHSFVRCKCAVCVRGEYPAAGTGLHMCLLANRWARWCVMVDVLWRWVLWGDEPGSGRRLREKSRMCFLEGVKQKLLELHLVALSLSYSRCHKLCPKTVVSLSVNHFLVMAQNDSVFASRLRLRVDSEQCCL
jgi:hypothetical protein